MNRSVERANEAADARKRADWEYEDQQRRMATQRQQQDMTENVRRYDLGREDDRYKFDTRRSQFDGLMRMLFGGGEPQPMEQNALRMRARSPMPLYDAPQDDGIDRRGINNSLARFIRGGM